MDIHSPRGDFVECHGRLASVGAEKKEDECWNWDEVVCVGGFFVMFYFCPLSFR